MKDMPPISANVWINPASKRRIIVGEALTSENIADFAPDAEVMERVISFFRKAGFEVRDVLGPIFTIVGSRSLFEKVFDSKINVESKEGLVLSVKTGHGGYELPLKKLPRDIVSAIYVVTFEPPPDFGPTENYA